jgi:carbonic anhydrase/acetyltransferase-like protein (isoleucine patch superfamily)
MICSYKNFSPKIPDSVFVAPNATVIGDVEIGEESSIWFNAVVRGDVNPIRIGARTNIQDSAILHVTLQKTILSIGSNVTVGHAAILHGCFIEDFCLVGMGARILDGAYIGKYSLVAAGALVREGVSIPEQSLIAGVPAIVKRSLALEEIELIKRSAERYMGYRKTYLEGGFKIL